MRGLFAQGAMAGSVMGFSLRRPARLAATLGTGVLTVWIIASLDSLGVTDFKNNDAAVPLEDRGGKTLLSAESEPFYAPHVIVNADTGTSVTAYKVTEEWDRWQRHLACRQKTATAVHFRR